MPTKVDEPEDDEGEPECDHIWHYIDDWEGDPTLHNGTNDLSHWECSECGMTMDKDAFPREIYRGSRWDYWWID